MAKGTRYTPEFKAKTVRLLTESRGSYSSETKAIERIVKDLGITPESLRRWRDKADATGERGNQTIGRGRNGRAQAAATGERGVAAGERDFDDSVGFFAAGIDPARR